MKEDQELLETEASMRRHQSMQRLSRGELVDSHMDEELVRSLKNTVLLLSKVLYLWNSSENSYSRVRYL
jgi:hypothetical protein